MSIFLNTIKNEYPAVYAAKMSLNDEFFEIGCIRDAVSILYYPVQHGPMSHGELEVEGSCYSFRSLVGPCCDIPNKHSLHARIYRIRRNGGSFRQQDFSFFRFSIIMTPKQLHGMRTNISSLRSMVGLTCMHGVKRALKKYADYSIPFPICLYPTSTVATLFVSKKIFGDNRLSRIEPYTSHRAGAERVADAIFGIVPEAGAIAVSVGFLFIGMVVTLVATKLHLVVIAALMK